MTCVRKLEIFILGTVVLCSLVAAIALNPLTPTSVAIAAGGGETNRYRDNSSVAVSVTLSFPSFGGSRSVFFSAASNR